MIGVIPAAGLGTRMGGRLPKALVEIEGQTLLERSVLALKALAIRRIIIITGHLGENIREFISARDFGLEIQFARQDHQLGLPHAIAMARSLIDDSFIMLCPDNIFSNPNDLDEAKQIFLSRRPAFLMAATVTPTCQRDRARYFTSGLRNFAPHLYEYRASRNGSGLALTSTGAVFFAHEALNSLPSFDRVDTEVKFETYINTLAESDRGLLYQLRGTRYDLSAPEDIADYVTLQRQLDSTVAQGVSAILINGQGQVLLQHRDDNPRIRYPNHWSLFGGSIDPGETPYNAARREVREEIGYDVENLGLFREFVQNNKREFAFVGEIDAGLGELTLNEGQGMDFVSPAEFSKLVIRPDDRQTLASYFGE